MIRKWGTYNRVGHRMKTCNLSHENLLILIKEIPQKGCDFSGAETLAGNVFAEFRARTDGRIECRTADRSDFDERRVGTGVWLIVVMIPFFSFYKDYYGSKTVILPILVQRRFSRIRQETLYTAEIVLLAENNYAILHNENGSNGYLLPKMWKHEECDMTLNQLANAETFTRKDYYNAYIKQFGDKSPDALDYALRKEMALGSVIHIGRNQYAYKNEKRIYTYSYSPEAKRIAGIIQEEYPAIEFQIFELIQLNAFVNHLFAHNTVFVSVENDGIDYVFDSLRDRYPGRIMLKPKADEYFRYFVEDQIVVMRLPSESPKGIDVPWQSRIEKILVDVTVDKLLTKIISEGEYEAIFAQAYERYIMDTKAMLRYANRKGAGEKFKNLLLQYTDMTIGK